jgi:hypothetical protein
MNIAAQVAWRSYLAEMLAPPHEVVPEMKFVVLVTTCCRVSWPFQKKPASRLVVIVFWPVIGVEAP